GAAVASYAAFAVTFAASIQVLRKGSGSSDRLAAESALLGLLFAAITIAAGSVWAWAGGGVAGRPQGERPHAELVLFLVYAGSLALRSRTPPGPARERTSALYAVAGFALVPFSYLSIYIWRTLHPTVISPGGQGIGGSGAAVVLVSVAAYALLYAA